jgi:hypothetical protein
LSSGSRFIFKSKGTPPMPAKINFIQYLAPDGRKKLVSIERPDNIVAVADRLMSLGLRFECEVLSDGKIHLSISDNEQDYASYVCENNPEVTYTVDKMITSFDIPKFIKMYSPNSAH